MKHTDRESMNEAHITKQNLRAVYGVPLLVTRGGITHCVRVRASIGLRISEVKAAVRSFKLILLWHMFDGTICALLVLPDQ